MREIKFRGQRIDNIQWVYGHYFENKNYDEHIIMERKNAGYQTSEVYPGTIGQYTGLKDKNGKEIYEGDVVVFKNAFSKDNHVGKVRYYSDCKPISDDGHHSVDLAETNSEDLEVIGNIHENPELLEVN